jgi:hypothetical protein
MHEEGVVRPCTHALVRSTGRFSESHTQLTRCLLRKVEMTDPHEPSLGPDVWPAVDGFHKSGRRNSVNALSPPLNGDLEHRSAGQAPAGLGL